LMSCILKKCFENILTRLWMWMERQRIKWRLEWIYLCFVIVNIWSWLWWVIGRKAKRQLHLRQECKFTFLLWLKSLCYPDGHDLNIFRLVNLESYTLYRMKSYNYNMFCKHLFNLLTEIYWQKKYKMHSQRSVTSL